MQWGRASGEVVQELHQLLKSTFENCRGTQRRIPDAQEIELVLLAGNGVESLELPIELTRGANGGDSCIDGVRTVLAKITTIPLDRASPMSDAAERDLAGWQQVSRPSELPRSTLQRDERRE